MVQIITRGGGRIQISIFNKKISTEKYLDLKIIGGAVAPLGITALNMVSLSQDYIPSMYFYAVFQ